MSTRSYRLVVVGCLLSWFLLGLHAPLVHEFAAHGHVPRPSVLTAVALLTVAALAGAWVLLRTPRRGAT
jgi:hypothetical protein